MLDEVNDSNLDIFSELVHLRINQLDEICLSGTTNLEFIVPKSYHF